MLILVFGHIVRGWGVPQERAASRVPFRVSIAKENGLIQYITKTSPGSSGSPCFNEDWKVVALHHAQKSTHFGSIREGILLSAIYKEIQQHL